MNTQRNILCMLSLNLLFITPFTHTMQQQQIVPLDTTESDTIGLLISFGAGASLTAACFGAYYLFTKNNEKIDALEKRIRALEKNNKVQNQCLRDLQHDQENEVKRLDQTREWIFDIKEQHLTLVTHFANQNNTDIAELQKQFAVIVIRQDKMNEQIDDLQQKLYSAPLCQDQF